MSGRTDRNLRRHRGGHDDGRVTFVELFFDLVFVFAITQLSHGLLGHFTALAALQTAMLLLAVWWAWIYTSWFTNWLDPERKPVRLLLIVLMLVGLVLSMSIPQAFGSRGLAFAVAYVGIQVGRTAFMLWALGDGHPRLSKTFRGILAWFVLSGVFWIAGVFVEAETRMALWAVALVIEYGGPGMGYWLPGRGRAHSSDWDVEGAHMAERCGLFIIIALGESILVTGATFAGQSWNWASAGAFAAAFVGTAAMWWIYFEAGHRRGSELIAHSTDPGRLARLAYTYIHLPVVAGVVLTAVADEFILAHPTGHTAPETLIAAIGGPALYLIGNIAFKKTIFGRQPLSHLIGLGLLVLLIPAGFVVTPLLLGAGVAAALVIVAVWEMVALGRGPSRGSIEIGNNT